MENIIYKEKGDKENERTYWIGFFFGTRKQQQQRLSLAANNIGWRWAPLQGGTFAASTTVRQAGRWMGLNIVIIMDMT